MGVAFQIVPGQLFQCGIVFCPARAGIARTAATKTDPMRIFRECFINCLSLVGFRNTKESLSILPISSLGWVKSHFVTFARW